MTAALACWAMTTTVVSTVVGAAIRRRRRGTALIVAMVGCVLVCELAFAVYGLTAHGAALWTFAIYPVALLGSDAHVMGAPIGPVVEALTILPSVLTSCTAYALGLVVAPRRLLHKNVGP